VGTVNTGPISGELYQAQSSKRPLTSTASAAPITTKAAAPPVSRGEVRSQVVQATSALPPDTKATVSQKDLTKKRVPSREEHVAPKKKRKGDDLVSNVVESSAPAVSSQGSRNITRAEISRDFDPTLNDDIRLDTGMDLIEEALGMQMDDSSDFPAPEVQPQPEEREPPPQHQEWPDEYK